MPDYYSSWLNNYRILFRLSPGTQESHNNRTRVSYALYLITGSSKVNARGRGLVSINGNTVWSINGNQNLYNMSNHNSVTVASGAVWVPHNSDGSKTIGFRANLMTVDQSSRWRVPKLEVVGSLRLNPIPKGLLVKVNGTWKRSIVYVKHRGSWKQATPMIKRGTRWVVGGY